jgi:hypothetical protein
MQVMCSYHQLERLARISRISPGRLFAGGQVGFQGRVGLRKPPAKHGCQLARTHLLAAQSAETQHGDGSAPGQWPRPSKTRPHCDKASPAPQETQWA